MTYLSSLTLTAFRSYSRVGLEAQPGLVVLTGVNGAGKTNILEAISLLSPGRGLRRARLSEVQQFGSDVPWAVNAHLITSSPVRGRTEVGAAAATHPPPRPHPALPLTGEGMETVIGTGKDPATPDSDRRIVLLDGNKIGQPELNEHLAVTWLTPAMDRLWTDTPGTRRRFLDRLTAALDPAHTTRLNRYEDALAERNKLLKDGRMDDAWLSSIEHTLATEGVAVMAARRELVAGLGAILSSSPARGRIEVGAGPQESLLHEERPPPPCPPPREGGFPSPILSLEGIENWLADGPALLIEDRLREELAKARRFDAATGITTIGPHRSDLLAVHPEKNMPAQLCSTGEQKALLISLILGHAQLLKMQRNRPPILLLDEIGAHLDENRRESLYNQLFLLGSQVWMTGADSSLFSPLFGRVLCYEIGAGTVRETAPV